MDDARVAADWDDGGRRCGKERGADEVSAGRDGEGEAEGEDEAN